MKKNISASRTFFNINHHKAVVIPTHFKGAEIFEIATKPQISACGSVDLITKTEASIVRATQNPLEQRIIFIHTRINRDKSTDSCAGMTLVEGGNKWLEFMVPASG